MLHISKTERNNRHAGAAVPDQQMRSRSPRYPVDRYLVESSNSEMVNIIEDDIWLSEPALRPEDEIILRKLHDMLQSTADDLKLLSGELSKFHEPRVQIKTQPMPLDEEFNEKVHIEEIVNAKFHGYKIVDKPILPSALKTLDEAKRAARNLENRKSAYSCTTQPIFEACVNQPMKKPVIHRNLSITRPKIIAIDEKVENSTKNMKQHISKVKSKPSVVYNEFTYTYVESEKTISTPLYKFTIQDMPRIDIRSELREQKVLELDIYPDTKDNKEISSNRNNVSVISMEHNTVSKPDLKTLPLSTNEAINCPQSTYVTKQPARKVTKMSTCDSSGSTNNISSDTLHNIETQKHIKSVIRSSPKSSARLDRTKTKKATISKKETHLNTDEWKKKLNAVYGQPSTSKKSRTAYKSKVKNELPKKFNITPRKSVLQKQVLNNSEYIPYSQLTLGGVRVSDIEREISDISNKNDITLGPLLDKILSSQENSPRKSKKNGDRKERIFTTSDENLLEEVLDIERKVSKTIAKTVNVLETQEKSPNISDENKESDEKDSYADDFEEDRSENTEPHESKPSSRSKSEPKSNKSSNSEDIGDSDDDDNIFDNPSSIKPKSNIHNKTYTKVSNLSFKNSVDVFEFVHSVDTQEIATQSNTTQKISLKETQTSPRNDTQSMQSIHNDLWPSLDPNDEVEKMFKLEKDFIKKLIIDEYGDILEKNITKPSISRNGGEENKVKNVSACQKNTQTSPAHVKSVMTSPTTTKTRTTSPFLSVTVDHQTSPVIIVTNEHELSVKLDNEEDGISVNLSSPRFSLRLPQTSREILSNLEDSVPAKMEQKDNSAKTKSCRQCKGISSSSSIDGDNSSEISSLGEVKLTLKRKQKKRVTTISESSSTSTISKYSFDFNSAGIIPLRSEGEMSMGQVGRKPINKSSKSDGETSFERSK